MGKELQMQSAALEFEISLKAVSVLRYITDHTERYGSVDEVQGFEVYRRKSEKSFQAFEAKQLHYTFLDTKSAADYYLFINYLLQ